MSRVKDRARAEAGNRHINVKELCYVRRFVCAFCHGGGGTFVRVGDYLFHESCPKKMIPFTKEELKNGS